MITFPILDITDDLLAAMRLGEADEERTLRLLTTLARQLDGDVHWERGDEQWGVISNATAVVAAVLNPLPLVFLFGSHTVSLPGERVHVLRREHWHYIGHRVDRAVLSRALGYPLKGDIIDLEDFSIAELWFATVT